MWAMNLGKLANKPKLNEAMAMNNYKCIFDEFLSAKIDFSYFLSNAVSIFIHLVCKSVEKVRIYRSL